MMLHIKFPCLVGTPIPLIDSNFCTIVSGTTMNIQSQIWNHATLKSLASYLSSVHLPFLIPSIIEFVQVDLSPFLSLIVTPVKIQNLHIKSRYRYVHLIYNSYCTKRLTLFGNRLFLRISCPSQNQSWLSWPFLAHKTTSPTLDIEASRTFPDWVPQIKKYLLSS